MKIICLSDIHGNLLKDLPVGDTIVITGDICPVDQSHGKTFQKMWVTNEFIPYFSSLPYKNKLFIFGNHDFCGEVKEYVKELKKLCDDKNIHLLHDTEVIINGIKFYGTPYTPFFCNWAFNLYEPELSEVYEKIPVDTNVLLTHGPPFKIMDLNFAGGEHCGSQSLAKIIDKKLYGLKLHVFGHIHEPSGIINGTPIYVNASILDDLYIVRFKPRVVEI